MKHENMIFGVKFMIFGNPYSKLDLDIKFTLSNL